MRLIACPKCHTQFDVTDTGTPSLRCPCGAELKNLLPTAVDAEIRRCGSCGASIGSDADDCSYCGSAVVRDTHRLSLICPECYARNPEDSRFCTSCGIEFRPQMPAEDSEPAPCPACTGVTLRVRGIGGLLVKECPKCNGLWIPGENFDSLLQRAVEAHRRDHLSGRLGPASGPSRASTFPTRVVYRACPICGDQMQRRNFARRSGVITDWCGKHGTWLDADELEDIAAFIQRGGLDGTGTGSARKLSFQPADEETYEAVVQAHRLLAGERMKLEEKKRRLAAGEGGLLETLGDILHDLLGP